MAPVGNFFGGLLVLLASLLLLVLLAFGAGLMTAVMVAAFQYGWDVV